MKLLQETHELRNLLPFPIRTRVPNPHPARPMSSVRTITDMRGHISSFISSDAVNYREPILQRLTKQPSIQPKTSVLAVSHRNSDIFFNVYV
ncbi:hypothetical protein HanRHA438_Chr07g0314561 [Helianthus annuus]|nr:hypothetical protein HanRHA438_Chr07g0314561 [Helianthus annuus]